MEKLSSFISEEFIANKDLSPKVRLASESVGQVFTGQIFRGTGFVAGYGGRNFFISALHCFEETNCVANEAMIVFPSGEFHYIHPKEAIPLPASIKNGDILVVEVPNKNSLRALKLSEGFPFPLFGHRVTILGYPNCYLDLGGENGPVASSGPIDDLIPTKSQEGDFIWMRARVENGSSGSPVLDDCQRVIGVLTHTVDFSGDSYNHLTLQPGNTNSHLDYISVAVSTLFIPRLSW